jgi:uncharacterized protein (TIGR02996 family)
MLDDALDRAVLQEGVTAEDYEDYQLRLDLLVGEEEDSTDDCRVILLQVGTAGRPARAGAGMERGSEMASTATTGAAFLRSIEADLDDPAPLLIYADFLEEQGQDDMAYAWRWMARRGYRPYRRPKRGRVPMMWSWWHDGFQGPRWIEDQRARTDHPAGRLPRVLFLAMGAAGDQLLCHSLLFAVEWVAKGLRALRELAALEQPPGDPEQLGKGRGRKAKE